MLDMVRVVKAHPESNSVDVVFLRDGRRVAGVQCLSPFAGTDFGVSGLVDPANTGYDSDQNNKQRDIYGVIGWVGDSPIVVGFLFPQVAQCLFAELGFSVDRHPSDVYKSIDKDGNIEVYHPSGTFLRIATNPAHVDLTGKDYDKRWKISKNTDKAVHVHLEVANAGAVKATIDISPSGNIAISNAGTTTLDSSGAVSVTAPTVTINSTTTNNGNVTIEGNLNVSGVTTTGGLSSTGTAGGVSLSGDVSASGGSFTHNGTNVGSSHAHSGVQSGGSNTGAPV